MGGWLSRRHGVTEGADGCELRKVGRGLRTRRVRLRAQAPGPSGTTGPTLKKRNPRPDCSDRGFVYPNTMIQALRRRRRRRTGQPSSPVRPMAASTVEGSGTDVMVKVLDPLSQLLVKPKSMPLMLK